MELILIDAAIVFVFLTVMTSLSFGMAWIIKKFKKG